MQQKNVNVFVQATQIVCYVFTILVSINPLVLVVVQELALVNGFGQEKFYVLYFVMEEPEPCNILAEIKVRKTKNTVVLYNDLVKTQHLDFVDLM